MRSLYRKFTKVKLLPTLEQRDYLQFVADLCSLIYETEVERWKSDGAPKPAFWGRRQAQFNQAKKQIPGLRESVGRVASEIVAKVFSELWKKESMDGGLAAQAAPRDRFETTWRGHYVVLEQVFFPKCPGSWIKMESSIKQEFKIVRGIYERAGGDWWLTVVEDVRKPVGRQRSLAGMKYVKG